MPSLAKIKKKQPLPVAQIKNDTELASKTEILLGKMFQILHVIAP